MTLQWIAVSLFLAGALFALGRCLRSLQAWLALALCYGAALGSAGWWQAAMLRLEREKADVTLKAPAQRGAGGYATSDSCQACHPSQYASWHQSFHRSMTQLPSRETVRGQFANVTLELHGQKYQLQQRGDDFWVEMVDPDWNYVRVLRQVAHQRGQATAPVEEPNPPRTWKRISMLTGSHHMQAYWTASEFGNMQFSFPFTYFFEENRWVPRNDIFLLDPSVPFHPQVWNVNCINCHATAGQPRQDPATKVINSRTVELGISCEACHGPSEEHARLNRDPRRRYLLHERGRGDPSVFNPARADHVKSSEACGQCHATRRHDQIRNWNSEGIGFIPGHDLEARYPALHYDGSYLDRPGQNSQRAVMEGTFWRDGEVRVSGREFLGLAASGCYQRGQISCLSCHSMHRYQDTDDQLATGMEANQACLQCHSAMAATLTAHTRHQAGSSGSLCYNCHMPHTTYGLVGAIRNHHIDSPKVQATLATGRPNACNLCHLDRTLEWTGRHLHEWYGQPLAPLGPEQQTVSAALLWLLKGDAGQRALAAWSMGWAPARQAAGEQWLAPNLAELLMDPYSTVRCIAQRSLKRLPGYAEFTYDYIAPQAERAAGRERALALWRSQNGPALRSRDDGNALLLRPDGTRAEEKVAAILGERDDHPMELLE